MLKFPAMRPFSTIIALVLFALPAVAHPVPFSYLDFQIQPGSIDVSLTIHIYDVAHDLQVTPMERLLDPAFVTERESAIEALLGPRLELTADDRAVRPEWSQPEILQERQAIRFHLLYVVPSFPGKVSIS